MPLHLLACRLLCILDPAWIRGADHLHGYLVQIICMDTWCRSVAWVPGADHLHHYLSFDLLQSSGQAYYNIVTFTSWADQLYSASCHTQCHTLTQYIAMSTERVSLRD